MLLRPRTIEDLDGCEALARAVQRSDGYPPYIAGDLRSFLAVPALGAWVATDLDGRVVGHVALLRASSPPVMALASEATHLPIDRLGVVARLLVAAEVRRQGVGRRLLAVAADAARERDLWPVLDVVKQFAGAISLYERCGWECAGEVTVHFDEVTLEELVFIGPSP